MLPSSPFTRTLVFAGVLESSELLTPTFSIEVAYSTIGGHSPTGIIRGTSADFDALEKFFRSKKSALCTARSISKERETITCTGVHIKEIREQRFAKDEKLTIHQVIGRFTIERLEISKAFNSSSSGKKRRIVFFLTGPSQLWLSHAMRTISYTGEITVEQMNTELTLDCVPDRITLSPHFVLTEGARLGRTPRETGQAELFSLTVDDADGQRDGVAFSTHATALTDTLCLLMGFLSKAYISWFASAYSDDRMLIETYRDVEATESEAPGWEDVILSPNDIRAFLNKAFLAYNERAKRNFDVRLPILHYIWSQSSRFAEERFTLLFFALEKLLSSLDAESPDPELLSDAELREVWKVIHPKLEGMNKTCGQIDLIRQKRRELQRAPLKHRLKSHLCALDISLEDINGDEGLASMIGVRNLLTHEKGELPIAKVMFETSRLETVPERTLLKLLAWTGKDKTPTYRNLQIRDQPL